MSSPELGIPQVNGDVDLGAIINRIMATTTEEQSDEIVRKAWDEQEVPERQRLTWLRRTGHQPTGHSSVLDITPFDPTDKGEE